MTVKNRKPWLTEIVAIAGIVVLECVALGRGYNGTLLTLAIAAVAGIGGWAIHRGSDVKAKGD